MRYFGNNGRPKRSVAGTGSGNTPLGKENGIMATRTRLAGLITVLAAIFAGGGMNDKASASMIPLSNPSFELDAVLPKPAFTSTVDDWTSAGANAGVYNVSDYDTLYSPSHLPTPTDGGQIAWMNANSLTQVLSTVLAPDTQYTLQADFSAASFPAGYTLSLYAGVTLLGTVDHTSSPPTAYEWTTVTVPYLSPSVVAPGQALEIVITTSGSQLLVDNVRLEAEAPEPASASILLASGLALLGVRRR